MKKRKMITRVVLAIFVVAVATVMVFCARQQGKYVYDVAGHQVRIRQDLSSVHSCQELMESWIGDKAYGVDTTTGDMWLIAQRDSNALGERTVDFSEIEQDDGTVAILFTHHASSVSYVITGDQQGRPSEAQLTILAYLIENIDHWDERWEPFKNASFGDIVDDSADDYVYVRTAPNSGA